jgi:PAS domain S-box-containing protein
MSWFNNLSIKRKLILLLFGITLIAQAIAFSILTIERFSYLKKELLDQSKIQARLISEYCVSPLVFEDVDGLKQLLQKIEVLPFILSVGVYNQDGNLVSFYQKKVETEPIPQHEKHDDGFFKNMLHIREAINYHGIEYGKIHLKVSTEQLRKQISGQIWLFAFVIFGMLIFIYFLANRFQRIISEPILNLAEFSDEISKTADYSLQIQKQSNDEIGTLYENFNNMIQQINKRQEEKDKADEALVQSTKRLIQAQQIAKMGDFTWDVATGEVSWSDGLFDLLKYDKTEKIDYAKVNEDIHYPDDLLEVSVWLNEGIASGEEKLVPKEYRLICKDGEVIYVHTKGIIERKEGKSVKLIATLFDITEKKKAEEALQISELKSRNQANFLDAIIENSPFAMWVSDAKGMLIRANQALRNILNLTDDMIVGKYNVLHDDNMVAQGLMSVVEGVFNDLKSARFIMFWTGTKAGNVDLSIANELWIDVSMFPITDEVGKLVNVVCQYVDITERKQAELELKKYRDHLEELVKSRTQDLESSNKELEAFAYSVSHDLRAPLRAIDGFTRILLEDYVEKLDEEANRLGSIIQKNSRKMGKLIDDLLAFSRLGRATMHFSEIDMKSLVNDVYLDITSQEERKKINFELADLPKAYGDLNMLRQVWTNLFSNAIKFSAKQKKPVISVTCWQENKKSSYCVLDNGAGFNMKYKDKLFGVFQRLHSEKEFTGTGVGLALVKRIIQRHDGTIWAEGEIDKGAAFYFSLPKEL